MTTVVTASAITATGATLNISGQASGTVEVQIGLRKDFAACLANVLTGIASSASTQAITGLNQSTTYYIRARTRLSGGAAETWGPTSGFATPAAAARNFTVPAVVMDPAMLVVPDPVISIADSSGGERNGFPVVNLTYDDPVSFQSVGSGGGAFAIQFQTAGQSIDTLALLCTNLPEAAIWRLKGAATQAALASSPGFTDAFSAFRASANMPGRHLGFHGLMRLSQQRAYPWWQLDIACGSAAAGPPLAVMVAQHLIVGRNRSTKNLSIGLTEQGANLGSIERTRSGVANRQDGYRIRNVEFDISQMTEDQYQAFYRDLHYRTNDAVLVVPNPKAGPYLHDRICYGSLNVGKSQLVSSIRQTKTISVDSLI